MSDFENQDFPEKNDTTENSENRNDAGEQGFVLKDADTTDAEAQGAAAQTEESAGGQAAYTDANYAPAEDPFRDMGRPYGGYKADEEKKTEKKSDGFSFRKVVALCLVFLLIGGLGGYGIMKGIAGGRTDEKPVLSAKTDDGSAEPTASPALTAVTTTGEKMSSQDIYTMACSQMVGVTTEVTYTNIFGQPSSGAVSGSGFVVSKDGYIMTNYHVIQTAVEEGYDVSVMFYDGSTYTASIVGYEKDNDVAVLKIDADKELNPVTIGDSNETQVGDTVYAVGNPLGELTYTMTSGMVSALDREISTEEDGTTINMFQIDAAINSGNSGGPVYNEKGEVIGIVTAKYQNTGVEGLGFAIPIADAVDIANDLITNGYVTGKAYMGVTVITVSSSVAEYYNMVEGAYIYALDENSCAAKAGLQVGDIITKIGDTEVKTASDLIAAKKDYAAGDTATLTVYRSGQTQELSITFDEQQPDSSSGTQQPDVGQTQSGGQSQSMPGGESYGNSGTGDPFSNFNF